VHLRSAQGPPGGNRVDRGGELVEAGRRGRGGIPDGRVQGTAAGRKGAGAGPGYRGDEVHRVADGSGPGEGGAETRRGAEVRDRGGGVHGVLLGSTGRGPARLSEG